MSVTDQLYATCASGLEQLLAEEIRTCGGSNVNVAGSGVRFDGALDVAYRACVWSRVANRILLPIHSGAAASPEALYAVVQEVDWAKHLEVSGTLAVDFYCSHSNITHSQFGALKVKDAVVDQYRDRFGVRPNVERDQPDVQINVYLYRNKARIAIDLSGSSLHRRGYREQAGPAPIKENLAAALLLASGWPTAMDQACTFVDPMCGSGTIAIEAAMIACQQAPGLHRDYFGFLGWLQHDAAVWQQVKADALAARKPSACLIVGSDSSAHAINLAQQNAVLAKVDDAIEFVRHDVLQGSVLKSLNKQSQTTQQSNHEKGFILSNPPYGERLSADALFYENLGKQLSQNYSGWKVAVITANAVLLKHARLPFKPLLDVRNGGMDCQLFEGTVPLVADANAASLETEQIDATDFINRVKKNNKRLKSWVEREGIRAWRAYDADLPDYAVAIDVYECANKHVVVQEYQAPVTVNAILAEARLNAIMAAIPELYNVSEANVHLKVRQKQTGRSQYERRASQGISDVLVEQNCEYELNFTDYLDTGIFLDHRKVRRHIFDSAQNKKFLNLFAYTGAATVAAIAGGAKSSVSVDLSNRYCQWTERNIRRNQQNPVNHSVVKSDVMQWLAENKNLSFDLILLDPPTFSNSTGIDADWNVQREHVSCIKACMALLEKDGLLIFSNNYRRFKLDMAMSAEQGGPYIIEDKNRWSVDTDFQRNARIHQCWFIRHA